MTAPHAPAHQFASLNPLSKMYNCHNTGLPPSPLWSIAIDIAVIAIPFHRTFHPVLVFSSLCPPTVYPYPISDPLPYPPFPLLSIPHSPHHSLPRSLLLQPLFSFTTNLFQELYYYYLLAITTPPLNPNHSATLISLLTPAHCSHNSPS